MRKIGGIVDYQISKTVSFWGFVPDQRFPETWPLIPSLDPAGSVAPLFLFSKSFICHRLELAVKLRAPRASLQTRLHRSILYRYQSHDWQFEATVHRLNLIVITRLTVSTSCYVSYSTNVKQLSQYR